MATLRRIPSGTWHVQVRRRSWPAVARTLPRKRDAQDWATEVENEMRRGSFVRRDPAERMTLSQVIDRYLSEVTPRKKLSSQRTERGHAERLRHELGQYSRPTIINWSAL